MIVIYQNVALHVVRLQPNEILRDLTYAFLVRVNGRPLVELKGNVNAFASKLRQGTHQFESIGPDTRR